MRFLSTSQRPYLLAYVAGMILNVSALSAQTGSYTDMDTGITFYGHVLEAGYRFGMVMPETPTTDFIVQIVSPSANKVGWGGISLGSSMVGTLLLATWPNGDGVGTAPMIAHNYTVAGTVPYTANHISLSPIKQGTFANSTHISSTFLCRGCINKDSFSTPSGNDSSRSVFFGYAYSPTAVTNPSDTSATLSDHTSQGGDYGAFSIVLSDAKSEQYDKYAAMADVGIEGVPLEQPKPTTTSAEPVFSVTQTAAPTVTAMASPTPTPECAEAECEDFSHRKMSLSEILVLAVVGLLYLRQAFLQS